MRQFYFTLGLILGLGVAVFAMQNTLAVEVRFLVWQAHGPLALVVLASAAAGVLIALLFCLPAMLRDRWRIRSLERRLELGAGSTETDGSPRPAKEPR
jgi:lipopolysaccharide assembly protein A